VLVRHHAIDNPPFAEGRFILPTIPHRYQHSWDVDLTCCHRSDLLALLVSSSERAEVAGYEFFPAETGCVEGLAVFYSLIKQFLETWSPVLSAPVPQLCLSVTACAHLFHPNLTIDTVACVYDNGGYELVAIALSDIFPFAKRPTVVRDITLKSDGLANLDSCRPNVRMGQPCHRLEHTLSGGKGGNRI